jgi:hypothetical protein
MMATGPIEQCSGFKRIPEWARQWWAVTVSVVP